MKKFLLTALAAVMTLCFCSCVPYTEQRAGEYNVYPLLLKSGQSFTFDIEEMFGGLGFTIDDCRIEESRQGIFTSKGNTITAIGTGTEEIYAKLRCEEERTIYIVCLGKLYTYDEKHCTEVKTVEDLQNINAKGGRYILKNDIDLSSMQNWQPIDILNLDYDKKGLSLFVNPYGYVIKNFKTVFIAGESDWYAGGFFGELQNVLVQGVKLQNVSVDASGAETSKYAGCLVGDAYHCYIKDCVVEGSVKSDGYCGGIAALSSYTTIENCSFSGRVEGYQGDENSGRIKIAGGIAGYFDIGFLGLIPQNRIHGCVVRADVVGTNIVGGMAGYIYGRDFVSQCVFEGSIDQRAQHRGEVYGYGTC